MALFFNFFVVNLKKIKNYVKTSKIDKKVIVIIFVLCIIFLTVVLRSNLLK